MANIEWKWKSFFLSGVFPLFLLVFAGSASHAGGEFEYLLIAFLVAISAVFVISIPLMFGLVFFRNPKYLKFSSAIPLVVLLVFLVSQWFRF
jgi:hypothetical protein